MLSPYHISYFNQLQASLLTSTKHQSTLLASASLSKISSEKKYIFLLFLCNFFRLSSWPIDVWLQGELRWVKCIFWNLFHFPHTISELQPCAENRMILIKKYFHFIKPKAPKIKFDPTSKLWVVFEGACAKNDKISNLLGYSEKVGSISENSSYLDVFILLGYFWLTLEGGYCWFNMFFRFSLFFDVFCP